MLEFSVKNFSELTINELYKLLQLRSEVFVVEQNCVYQDIDGKDVKSLHILGFKSNQLVAYTRIFNKGDYFKYASIGRVVVKKSERKLKHGNELMKFSIKIIEELFKTSKITISAQLYLQKFYESYGFKKVGLEYLEDDIPHIKMIRK